MCLTSLEWYAKLHHPFCALVNDMMKLHTCLNLVRNIRVWKGLSTPRLICALGLQARFHKNKVAYRAGRRRARMTAGP